MLQRVVSFRKAVSLRTSIRYLSTDGGDDDGDKPSRFASLTESTETPEAQEEADRLNLQSDLRFIPPSLHLEDETQAEIVKLHRENPELYTSTSLATKFKLSHLRVKAILQLNAVKQVSDAAEKLGIQRALKEDELTEETLYPEKEKVERVDPIYAYLEDSSDYVPGLFRPQSESSRRKVWRDHEDYYKVRERQEKAQKEIQIDALPSFSAFDQTKVKFTSKIAIKDLSKKDAPLMIRDQHGVLRIATPEEACNRTWVKRPPAIDLHFATQ